MEKLSKDLQGEKFLIVTTESMERQMKCLDGCLDVLDQMDRLNLVQLEQSLDLIEIIHRQKNQ